MTAPPGLATGVHAHHGDEHHLILSGRWRMTQGDHVVELGPGDYLAWDPAVPHDVENIGDEPGRILIVYPRRGRRPAPTTRPGPRRGIRRLHPGRTPSNPRDPNW